MLYLIFCLLICFTMIPVESASLKVPRLKVGDTIGFISPAGTLAKKYPDKRDYINHVTSFMNKLGLKIEWGTYAFGPQYGYLAATDEQRASDIMSMFKNKNVAAIVANRGGWGCDRILDLLDFNIIKNNPKAIVGYSDLTTLINSINYLTGMVTFHGPMGVDEWNMTSNMAFFQKVLMDGKLTTFSNQDNFPITTIVPGKARGILFGGNLAVFTSMIGSKYLAAPNTRYILFLEEISEAPYRIDRMLTQLQLSGYLNNIAGIVWGRCSDCKGENFSVDEVLQQKFGHLSIPVFSGAMIGHIRAQYTLPLGTLVEIDADKGTIEMLESPLF